MSVLALATSIDALAVGVTLSFLSVEIVPAVSFIGIITFLFSGSPESRPAMYLEPGTNPRQNSAGE